MSRVELSSWVEEEMDGEFNPEEACEVLKCRC